MCVKMCAVWLCVDQGLSPEKKKEWDCQAKGLPYNSSSSRGLEKRDNKGDVISVCRCVTLLSTFCYRCSVISYVASITFANSCDIVSYVQTIHLFAANHLIPIQQFQHFQAENGPSIFNDKQMYNDIYIYYRYGIIDINMFHCLAPFCARRSLRKGELTIIGAS